ncbi:unnamed protein product, partial [Musa acuminata subsp. burmannicoides]
MSLSSSSSSDRSVPEVCESTPRSPRIEVISSSLGGMSSVDHKTSTALKIMRSWYDVDSCPYDLFPDGFELTTDALEAGLRFHLNLVIEKCLRGVFPWGVLGGGNQANPNAL